MKFIKDESKAAWKYIWTFVKWLFIAGVTGIVGGLQPQRQLGDGYAHGAPVAAASPAGLGSSHRGALPAHEDGE